MRRVIKAVSKNQGGIWTDLEGRLERLDFAIGANVYTPVFEAIHNSLDAIEQSSATKGEITIQIEREQQLKVADDMKAPPQPVLNIIITDNGKGFDTANLESFQTLDSQQKLKRGGKGVGRLFWLKAFESCEVESVFEENGAKFKRKIAFSSKSGCVDEPAVSVPKNTKQRTTVRLIGYRRLYESVYRNRKPSTVASDISKHFLPFLLFGKPCVITLIDGDEKLSVSREGLPVPETDKFTVCGEQFTLHHIRMPSGADGHVVSLCASGRVVKDIKLLDLDIPVGKKGKIKRDDNTEFHYVGYVTAPYFDKKVNTERTGFRIEPEKIEIDGLEVVSLPEIRERAKEAVERYLKDDLAQLQKTKEARIGEVLDGRLSPFKYLKEFNEKQLKAIPLDDTKEEIEKKLTLMHYENHWTVAQEAEYVLRRINVEDPNSVDFQKDLEKFADVLKVHQADLGQYVLYRAWILDLLSQLCSKREDGKYELEKAIHSLIFPMRVDEWRGADLPRNKHNLWLIDERFAMFDYISSDLELSKHKALVDVDAQKRPDLCCYFFGENQDQTPLSSVTLIELKRPGKEKPYSAKDDGNPLEQLLGYIDLMRGGKIRDQSGREIVVAQQTKFFCYAICDTENAHIRKIAALHQMEPSLDSAGYYVHYPKQNAYIEIISLKKLLSHARMRNKLFFEKLGLPTSGLRSDG
jgi:hypothetical protein